MLKELNSEYSTILKKIPKAFDAYKKIVEEKSYRLLAGHTYAIDPVPLRQNMKVCRSNFK